MCFKKASGRFHYTVKDFIRWWWKSTLTYGYLEEAIHVRKTHNSLKQSSPSNTTGSVSTSRRKTYGLSYLKNGSRFIFPDMAIFEDLDCVGNKIEADLCHYAGVSHVADVDLRNFEIAVHFFFEVIAEHTVGLDA